YLDVLEAKPRDIDLGAQLPHGALRVFVMGERAARLEEATPEEVAEMRLLTAAAMRAGALGFSTSRTLNHRTVKGDPTPSLRASEAELLGIALGMKDAGRGVIEFISDFNTPSPESEFEMIDRLLSDSGRPFSVSPAATSRCAPTWRRGSPTTTACSRSAIRRTTSRRKTARSARAPAAKAATRARSSMII